jgi:hypothetical protein
MKGFSLSPKPVVPLPTPLMGLIIIDKPVLWHSSRVPGEYNWDKMTLEQIKLIRTRFHDVLLSLSTFPAVSRSSCET